MTFKAFANPPDLMVPGTVNTRAWRAAEIPAANGHADARSLARLYGALARGGELDGVRVLSREAIERARVEQSYGEDAVLFGLPTRFGLGFMLDLPEHRIAPQGDIFGHPGAGGSIGFADPEGRHRLWLRHEQDDRAAGLLRRPPLAHPGRPHLRRAVDGRPEFIS